MKKLFSFMLVLAIVFSLATTAFAYNYDASATKGDAGLMATPISANYIDNKLVLKLLLSNTSNRAIKKIDFILLDVLNTNGEKAVTTRIDNFKDLYLNPGDSTVWTQTVTGANVIDLKDIKFKYDSSLEFGKIGYSGGVNVVVNNNPVQGEVPAFIDNGSTLVPLRAIFESVGAKVDWDSENSIVKAERNGTKVMFKIGEKYISRNGVPRPLEVAPQIVNGSTMIPLRAVIEAFDGAVNWGKVDGTFMISIRMY